MRYINVRFTYLLTSHGSTETGWLEKRLFWSCRERDRQTDVVQEENFACV